MMTLKYLGTAAAEGIPALFCECDICRYAHEHGGRNLRLRSSVLVNGSVLIDFPPDMLVNSHRFGLNLAKAKAVFFTHSHIDHLAASELCYYFEWYSVRADMSSVLHLYGNEKVLAEIRRMFEFDMERVPPCVALHRIAGFGPVTVDGVMLTPLPAEHDGREACFVYLIEAHGARALYCNDTTMPPEETIEFLRDKRLDLASLDCTAGRFPCSGTHMGFPDNLQLRRRLMEIGAADGFTRFVAHHFSHNGGVNYDDFAQIAEGTSFESSYDGMEVEL